MRDVEHLILFLWGPDCIRAVADGDVIGGGAVARPYEGGWRIDVAISLRGQARTEALARACAAILLHDEPGATWEDVALLAASALEPHPQAGMQAVMRRIRKSATAAA